MKNKQHIYIVIAYISFLSTFVSCINKKTKIESSFSDESFWSSKLLNSERIKLKFGNYHIKAFTKSSILRVSDLYTVNGKKKTTRTLAVVNYPEVIDSILIKEHTKIIEGGSMGKVFKDAGWNIKKESYFIGTINQSFENNTIYQIMGGIEPCDLAVYIYGFNLEKYGQIYNYALISEVYHPDYLTQNDLDKIYKNINKHPNKVNYERVLSKVKKEIKNIDYNLFTYDEGIVLRDNVLNTITLK